MSALAARLDGLDSGDQLGASLELPEQIRDALWRVESAAIEPFDAGGLVIAGMGGSAIGGDLARAALGDRQVCSLMVVRGYGLPVWTPPDRAVLLCSYSGDTEETIGCYAAAEAAGATRVVATTGGALAEEARRDAVPIIPFPAGLSPRAAVGYTFTVAVEVAALASCAPAIRTELDAAAAHLEERTPQLLAEAATIADRLEGTIPCIYGGGLTGPVAYRWKCQFNENAKLPSFAHELPEADHNEIVGWFGAPDAGRFSAIFLTDSDQHPRERRRFELTAELAGAGAAEVVMIETSGESRSERLLAAVMLGDLVSLELAARRGLDPTPVEVIEVLKDRLGRP